MILAAQSRDAGAIAALRNAVAEHMAERFGPGQWSAPTSRAEVLRQIRASQVLVAWDAGNIVGTLRLATVNPRAMASAGFTPVQTALYIFGLVVAPDYQRTGIGRRLVEAAQEQSRQRRADALWLDTVDGQAGAGPFYLRCGFRRVTPASQGKVPVIYYEWLVG
jgi:GNAT superfamily N-acetyltransferase